VKQQYVQYINEKIKTGSYRPQDIVSNDETNFDFDQASGKTLANRGDKTIGCDVTGSANRCTVLLACTMSGENLPPYIIFKGKDTRGSHVWKEFSTEAKWAEPGYPKESLFAFQDKAWMDQKCFLDWNTRAWTPFTQRPAASGHGSYMIMGEFKVHLMGACLNVIQNTSTKVDFVIGGYTGCVQTIDKGANHQFEYYACEELDSWMLTNLSSRHPTRSEVASWVNTVWKKITEEAINNTWKSVCHFVPGEFGDPLLELAPNTESVLVEVQDQEATAYNDDSDNCDDDDDDTIENEEEDVIMEELEPLFSDGCRLRSNLLNMDDEEPLFVM
jgi:hypothetical protein